MNFETCRNGGQAGKVPPSQVDLAVDRVVDLPVNMPVDLAVDRAVDLPCRLILAWVHQFEFWAVFWRAGRNLMALNRIRVNLRVRNTS